MLSSASSDAVMYVNEELLFAVLAVIVITYLHIFAFNYDLMAFVT